MVSESEVKFYWDTLKEAFSTKSIFDKYAHHSIERTHHLFSDTRIVNQNELKAALEFLKLLEDIFLKDSNHRIYIEINVNQRYKKHFSTIERFVEYLQDNCGKKEAPQERGNEVLLFRYSNFGIAIEGASDLYVIHPGYIDGYTYVEGYHYFYNGQPFNHLKPLSYAIKDADIQQSFLWNLKKASDPRSRVLFLHLYIEYCLDQLIKKKYPNHEIMGSQLKYYSQKLNFLKVTGNISNELFESCKEINRVRNRYAHELFVWEELDRLFDLSKINLRNYKIDVKNVNASVILDAIVAEIINEINDIQGTSLQPG